MLGLKKKGVEGGGAEPPLFANGSNTSRNGGFKGASEEGFKGSFRRGLKVISRIKAQPSQAPLEALSEAPPSEPPWRPLEKPSLLKSPLPSPLPSRQGASQAPFEKPPLLKPPFAELWWTISVLLVQTVLRTFDLTGDATFNNRTMNFSNSNGTHFYKNTNDVSEVFRVNNDVAYFLFWGVVHSLKKNKRRHRRNIIFTVEHRSRC